MPENRLVKIIPRYFRFPRKGFKRGSHLLLYNKDDNRFFGTMKLVGFKEGTPEELIKLYKDIINIKIEELREYVGSRVYDETEKVVTLEVDWYREFRKKIPIENVSGIDKDRIRKDLSDSLYSIPHDKYTEIVGIANDE